MSPLSMTHVASLALEHAAIAAPAIIATPIIATPLAYASRNRPIGGYLMIQGASLLFAIPAIPLLVAIPAVIGISRTSPITLIILLSLYGVAVMSRHVATAFSSIPEEIYRSTQALGYGPWGAFVHVNLPVALPAIIRSLRLVSASTLSMTVGAIVGIPGLGVLITDGYQHHDISHIIVGIVATAMLAALFDFVITISGRRLCAWSS